MGQRLVIVIAGRGPVLNFARWLLLLFCYLAAHQMRWELRAGRGLFPTVTETVQPYQRCGAQNRSGGSGRPGADACGATLARSDDRTAARRGARALGPLLCYVYD
ncbi:MAG: hypothetical protein ACREXX_07715 [Gammaproteobacteria bacterium]